MREVFRNWAGNQVASPAEVCTPASTDEVAEAVARAAAAGRRVRMAGSGHSFTGVALTDGLLLRPDALTGVREVGDGRVRVAAGTPLHVLNAELHRRGLALANLGDITAQTIAGALQTGTHGTGRDVGGLADQVAGLELVLADGTVTRVGEDEADPKRRDLFDAARVGLGALGVVTEVTLKVVPSFLLRAVRKPMRLDAVLGRLDEILALNEHVDFYWFPHTDACLVKLNNRGDGPIGGRGPLRRWFDDEFLENTVFGALCELGARLPAAIPAINRLAGAALSSVEFTDVSYRVFATVRRVRFLEMEYAIPVEHLGTALRAVRDLIDRERLRISFPIEVRVSPPSDAWLSPAYGRPTAYLAFHVFHRTPQPRYFDAAERLMVRLDGRPHWGKLHTRDAAYLGSVYPRFGDFVALRNRLDPDRVFGNEYLDTVLG